MCLKKVIMLDKSHSCPVGFKLKEEWSQWSKQPSNARSRTTPLPLPHTHTHTHTHTPHRSIGYFSFAIMDKSGANNWPYNYVQMLLWNNWLPVEIEALYPIFSHLCHPQRPRDISIGEQSNIVHASIFMTN